MGSTIITTVVFDVGNVLALIDRLRICVHLASHSPLTPEEVHSRIFGTDIEHDAETGKYDSREQFRRIKERIRANHSFTYESFLVAYGSGLSPNAEGIECLKMSAASKRVFLLSNISYPHALWLFQQEELVRLPELHIFSFKVGVMKPDPGIWRAMFRLGSVSPDECLYIDDVEEYCRTAENLGMKTIHYRTGITNLQAALSKWL